MRRRVLLLKYLRRYSGYRPILLMERDRRNQNLRLSIISMEIYWILWCITKRQETLCALMMRIIFMPIKNYPFIL